MLLERNVAGFAFRICFGAALIFQTVVVAQTSDQLLQQAQAALEKKEYAEAAKALESYLSQNPQDFRAEFNLAYAYSLTDRRADAIRLYQNVLAREKELVPAHLNLGILLVEVGGAAEAVEHLRFVAARQPNDFRAEFYLAEALTATQRFPEAREAYERALKLKPDDAAAHLAFARLLAETDPSSAEGHLRAAMQAEPSRDDALLLLASVLERRASGGADTLAEAADLYRRYLDAHPDRPESPASPRSNDLRVRLGQLYATQKRYAEAIAQWEAARAAGETSRELMRSLLDAYLQGSEQDKAKAPALLDQMLMQDGNNAELRLLAGRLRMEKKQYPEAAEQFRRATELRPDSAEGYTNLASALYLLQDYEGTVAALAKVAALGQDNAGTHFLRAISLDKLHRLEPALESYRRFLALDAGKNPNQEFQARQRIRILTNELRRRGGRRR
ncbi:MAG: hypothetical protein A3H28_11375 [Acidobacteria bacterium RIFCSPLOWO2_02_FULL_61_28]|nr:MAG: hypothetical protein A3H28_11375 [Acidobacteria bacterium RIFCSPLOWO2_02_FULL_61_28]